MDFQKFVSLLDRSALFFTKASKFRDRYEATLPLSAQHFSRSLGKVVEKLSGLEEENGFNMETFEKEKLKFFRETTLINSWHINNEESAAMWDLYSSKNAGVALQSTYERLSECFEKNLEDPIFIGMVSYIDFKSGNDLSGATNLFDTVLRKRRSFSHESELRTICSLMDEENLKMFLNNLTELHPTPTRKIRPIDPTQKTDYGKYVSVDLDRLIENVFVYPSEEEWTLDLIKSVADKYGIKKSKIIKSNLYENPLR